MSKPTALYRFYDAEDVLLYVGITEDVDARFSRHRATKPWWPDVARHTIEWRSSREEAEAAENLAILAERPAWNVRNSPWAPVPEVDPLVAEARERGDAIRIADARADLSSAIMRVRLLCRCVFLTRRDKPQAALVPTELGELVVQVGGADEAVKRLRDSLA